jgi:LysM repeat protein
LGCLHHKSGNDALQLEKLGGCKMTDNDIIWRDNYSRNNENEGSKHKRLENAAYEAAIEENRRNHARFVKISAAAFTILAALLAILIFRGSNFADDNRVAAIEKKLDRLEDEFIALKVYIASKLDQAIKEMERERQSLLTQNSSEENTPAPAQEEQDEEKPKVHKVLPGESLARISRYHGLTIQQLREYNKLGPDSVIHPGDELKLTP